MTISGSTRAALACFALFVIVSVLMVTGVMQSADIAVLQTSAGWRMPWLVTVMQFFSTIGNWQWELPFAFVVAALLWRRGLPDHGMRFIAFCVVGELFYALTKVTFHRPRPTVVSHLSDYGGYSYPSGHTMLAPIIWGLGLWLIAEPLCRFGLRRMLRTIAIALPLLIGISRIYLGVHYPSDVVGGLVLGLAWTFYWQSWVSCNGRVARV